MFVLNKRKERVDCALWWPMFSIAQVNDEERLAHHTGLLLLNK